MNINRIIKVLLTHKAAIIPANYLTGINKTSVIPINGTLKRGGYWVNTLNTKYVFTDEDLVKTVTTKAHWGFVRIPTNKLAITGYRNSVAYVGA